MKSEKWRNEKCKMKKFFSNAKPHGFRFLFRTWNALKQVIELTLK